ncbi:hypothetical protein [Streptomyces sp. NBC_00893]|nr:hypothetical protein [Streptomyces sp. NBC_00893]MCX4851012.1 hypothetical protein [Streptomyces sp. NBC_00893]
MGEAIGTVVKAVRSPTVCGLEVHGIQGDRRELVADGRQSPIRVARP